MNGTYSFVLVGLSLLVAVLASYTALDLAQRITRIQVRRYRLFWLIGGAVAMGVGVWAMHFIGMLAYTLPIVLGYDTKMTLLSLVIGITASWFALNAVTRAEISPKHLLAGGLLMGLGISAMHYTGMAAMLMHPHISHDLWLFIVSVVIAIIASIVALWIAFALRGGLQGHALPKKIAAAVVMGGAITGTHYIGMASANFAPDAVSLAAEVDGTWLTITTAAVSFSILIIALILSVLDAQLELQSRTFTQSLKDANDKLLHLATHDALTNLPNRLVLAEKIHRAIDRARRSGKRFAVIYIDLDGFKMINDSLGHLVGDALLKSVATRISGVIRRGQDTLARMGGDEFVLLAEDLDFPEQCLGICQQVQAALRAPAEPGTTALHITASIGIAVFPTDGDAVESLLHNADAAMYEVKRSGRNAFRYFEPAMNTTTLRTVRIQADLRKALDDGELYLHYQPKFLGDGLALNGAEALIRWNHATLGEIHPGEFIPIAERTGLILEIGEWVIREACRQHLRWIEAGVTPMKIAVNLSARHLRQRNLVRQLTDIMQEYHLQPGLLMLEITESAAMEDAEENVAMINELQRAGFEISIDDFGTGYSSLSYLQKFRVSQIKIDRFFTDGLDKNQEGAAIVSAIIALAGALQLDVVAEGVETVSQLQKLKRLGCNQYQGHLLGGPMSPEAFTEMLSLRRARAV